MSDSDSKPITVTGNHLIIAAVILGLGLLAYYMGSHRDKFSVLRGSNSNEETAALTYYRNMVCKKCPTDPSEPLWKKYPQYCIGKLTKPLVVLHSDGDARVEDIFTEAVMGLDVIPRIVGGRPPMWVHDTPSVWCFTNDTLYKYGGKLCPGGIRDFASGLYAAEFVM